MTEDTQLDDSTEKPVSLLEKAARVIFYITLVALVYLATTHQPPIVAVSYGDKIQHLAAFGWLTTVSYLAWKQTWPIRFLIIFGFSASIEFAQYFISYRSASWYDLAANAIGILATEIFIISYLSKNFKKYTQSV